MSLEESHVLFGRISVLCALSRQQIRVCLFLQGCVLTASGSLGEFKVQNKSAIYFCPGRMH